MDGWYKTITYPDVTPEPARSFYAEFRAAALADAKLIFCENAALHLVHTVAQADVADDTKILVCRQLVRGLAVDQTAYGALLQASDMTLRDPRLPFAGKCLDG